MSSIVLITGASSGFGALTARALADAGHTVYAGMRGTAGRNRAAAAGVAAYGRERRLDLRVLELDVADDRSVAAAADRLLAEAERIDVIVHNAGHMVLGPAEAFTPDELAQVYDINVLSTQRVNRALLPRMRAQRDGLLVWVGSTSTRGGTPPYLAPYFAAKAAEDSLAVSYAAELARFGIDTTIVVPGAFTSGTNHFANAGRPGDARTVAAYEAHYAGVGEQVGRRLAELTPDGADPAEVAREIGRVVALPKGRRPFRVHVDPIGDGAAEVNALGDEVRRRFYERVGLEDLLQPAAIA